MISSPAVFSEPLIELYFKTLKSIMNELKTPQPPQKRVRREEDGTWSATVWKSDSDGAQIQVGRYHYRTRAQARAATPDHEIGDAGRIA